MSRACSLADAPSPKIAASPNHRSHCGGWGLRIPVSNAHQRFTRNLP
ncbi:hypothetical protein HMPREF3227_01738 [Corynebacterium sp. CMW7794]|nr:hypothetical protein HMPREF3227_01738 [Corynebacterium sp. CMW7794]